ncbi:MAG: hypothetical protein KBT02_03260 [Treponema sp.]|nr:hypothetical protein [Candidatus Treponema caballi]
MSAVENVARKGAGKQAMKMVTLYLSDRQYQRYQMQAEKQGRKAAELIRDAMDEYEASHFTDRRPWSSLSFDHLVSQREGAHDFLEDDWRSDCMDDQLAHRIQ